MEFLITQAVRLALAAVIALGLHAWLGAAWWLAALIGVVFAYGGWFIIVDCDDVDLW